MKVPFLDLAPQHRALRDQALAALAATYDANRFCLGQDVEEFERNSGAALGYAKGSLPVAENAAMGCLSLPIYPELTDAQVDCVIEAVNAFR